MGFFDDLAKNIALWGAVQASKGSNGKPDPYKAAGIAAGMGHFSAGDRARLGAMLGSEGAFDSDDLYLYGSGDDNDDGEWRIFCDDGSEYGLDPEDYDTEEEYEEALAEAKVAWREDCEDGREYGIVPEDYETEEEYEEALEDAKYEWRNTCEDGFEYGIDAEAYESEEEYIEALEEAKSETKNAMHGLEEYRFEAVEEKDITIPVTLQVTIGTSSRENARVPMDSRKKEQYKWRRNYIGKESYGLNLYEYETEIEYRKALEGEKEKAYQLALTDKNIYRYCAVIFENGRYPYHYRTEDTSLKIGDKVVVPVGRQNEEVIAEIVSVEEHTRMSVPYPVEKVKYILRRYDETGR